MIGEEYMDEDPCPCDFCASADSCDGWDAQHCCTYCLWMNEDPDCSDCDPFDI